MTRLPRGSVLAITLPVLLWATGAFASPPITFEFSGTSPDDPRTPAGIVTGSFTFDPAAAGIPDAVEPGSTHYPLISFSVTLGGQTVSTPTGSITVQNNPVFQAPSTDVYQVSADFGGVPFHSGSLSLLLITLADNGDTMFSDESLPLVPDFQNAAETRSGQFRFTSTPGLPQFSFFEDVVLAPLDTDDDGVPDEGGNAPCQTDQIEGCDDNCPFEPNRSGDDIQRDTDGDGTGDSCACGNVDRNERRDIFDALHIAQGTLSPPLITMIHPRACDADGNGTCDIFDALRVAQATLAPPLAEIVQECEAATVAPSTP